MPVTRTSNQRCRVHVRACEPFKASHLYGERITSRVYAVFSYGPHWPLFVNVDGRWFANTEKYSPTTTRHASYASPGSRYTPITCEQARNLVRFAQQDAAMQRAAAA